jgi:phage tail-like protein
MAEAATETVAYPFTSFNFEVDITLEGSAERLCRASFAECDGLELTMEVKTIREGGNNGVQHRLTGPYAYGTLTLKRGMTSSFDMWEWVERLQGDPSLRANADVVVFSADRSRKQAVFVVRRCVPVKLKAPPLNAKDGMVAIEELQLAYESLRLRPSQGGGGA